MTDNRLAGIALIAGQLGLILTLALHPSGKITPAEVDAIVRKLMAVHSIALASLPFMILGALGLARALWPAPNRLSIAGFVIYVFGIAAILSGIVIDGLVMPRLLPHLADAAQAAAAQARGATATPASADTWRTLMKYNGYLDMAFVQVSMIASAAAIAAWSCAMILGATTFGKVLSRAAGVYGLILGVLVVVGLVTGAFGAEHAISIVVFGQASWFIVVGSQLCRR
ncbi:MAG TPA: hypothetical protein VMI10_11335 [Terriglobales bacterium]|nr:hypothetical protein [Terriglobales bacterium]